MPLALARVPLLALTAALVPALAHAQAWPDPEWKETSATLVDGDALKVVAADADAISGTAAPKWMGLMRGDVMAATEMKVYNKPFTFILMLEDGEVVLYGGKRADKKYDWKTELGTYGELEAEEDPPATGGGPPPAAAMGAWVLLPLEKTLLATNGELGDVVEIDAKKGKIKERLESPWELERTFVGGDDWLHKIVRLGDPSLGIAPDEDTEEALRAARETFDAGTIGWIQGMATSKNGHIFVATARASVGPFVRERARVSVLELSDDLKPLSLTPIPGPIVRGFGAHTDEGVLVALERGGLMALGESRGPGKKGKVLGEDGRDMMGRVLWLSSVEPPRERKKAIQFPVAEHAVAAVGDYVYRCDQGAYALEKEKSVLRLPIERRHAATGAPAGTVEVLLPLDGDVEEEPGMDVHFRGRRVHLEIKHLAFVEKLAPGEDGNLLVNIETEDETRTFSVEVK